jgi:DNA-binding CsgD family transcriptional regulator
VTAAEREVARLVLRGLTNAQIARDRGTSPNTVANQLASIMRKTQTCSRASLAAILVRTAG